MLAAAVTVPAVLVFPLGLCAAVTAAGSACAIEYGIRQLGGMSGDVSGYAITIGELCGIVAFVLL
jgi:adenosylcobinamide-GDP ribazoletransferase